MRKSFTKYTLIILLYGLMILLFHVFVSEPTMNVQWILVASFVFLSLFVLLPLFIYTRYKFSQNEERLRSILNSTAEAIYGVDHHGRCTFVNQACITMLGFEDSSELIGQNMHELIHHSYEDGSKYPTEKCMILSTVATGEQFYSKEEVFYRKDGSKFHVEIKSNPQWFLGKIVGSVVSFNDISEKKKLEEHRNYLLFHDPVTGLYNQTYLHEELLRLDVKRNLPFSVIVADMNHLKLTNDTFGHDAGDELIQLIGAAIQKSCREDDIVARMGGDEFVILLPQTNQESAVTILQRVEHAVSMVEYKSIRGSIALGIGTKTDVSKNMKEVFVEAEEAMYQHKHVHQRKEKLNQLTYIMESLGRKSLREKIHANVVADIAEMIAIQMQLSPSETKKVKDAAYYHDIGKIGLSDDVLNRVGELSSDEVVEMKRHAVIGYRILSLFDETIDLAKGALEHHEYFDGTGYPKGLKGSDISLMGRIIAVAEAYDFRTNPQALIKMSSAETLLEIDGKSGKQFDPMVVQALKDVMSKSKRMA